MDISKTTVTITSFNGTAINDGTNYRANFPIRTPLLPESEPIFVERGDASPSYSGLKLKEREYTVVIHVVGGTVDALKTLFDTSDSTQKKLLVTDSADSKAWYVYAVPTSFSVLGRPDSRVVVINLFVADSVWRNNSTTTEAWTVETSGATHNWSVGGTKYALPIITLTPQTVRTDGLGYKRNILARNAGDANLVNYPTNILGGNLDHATLVSGGKAQADGDDWRIFINAFDSADKWAGGGGNNSATLRTWLNMDFAPPISMTLATAIAGTGDVSIIEFQATSLNLKNLKRLQAVENKILYSGTEVFTFTDVDIFLYRVTGTVRAQKNTSAGSHSVGDYFHWLQNDIVLAYGDSALTALAADDNVKPIFDLTNSTNTSWVYGDYYKKDSLRSAMWRPSYTSTYGLNNPTPSGVYGGTENTNTDLSSIASVMGMAIKAAYIYMWRAETATIKWELFVPTGVTTVSTSGKKMRTSSSWPVLAGLQVSTDGIMWTTIWNEAAPTTTDTWQALAAHSSVSLGGTYKHLRYVFQGTVLGVANAAAYFEVDSITLTLDSNETPVITVGAEGGDYEVDMVIQNDTTGHYIEVNYPSANQADIIIDCDAKTVKLEDGTSIRGALKLSGVRKEWLTVGPGSTTISVTESGLVDVDVSIAYQERSL